MKKISKLVTKKIMTKIIVQAYKNWRLKIQYY